VLAEGAFQDVATPPLRQVQTKLVSLTQRPRRNGSICSPRFVRRSRGSPPPRAERLVNHLRVRANPNFVGREKTLEEIHEKLFTSPATVLMQGKIEVITALGALARPRWRGSTPRNSGAVTERSTGRIAACSSLASSPGFTTSCGRNRFTPP